MLIPRVIPVLLVKDGGLVKTSKFKKPVYVGDPINTIRIFNEKEADEIVVLDISATPEAGPNLSLIHDIAGECFMPLSYGGGVRSATDAMQLFANGVEKVVLRRAAAADLKVVTQISNTTGAQSVAVAVDVRRSRRGGYRMHAPGTRLHGSREWLEFAIAAEQAGAGEIVLTCIDREGTMSGLEHSLIREAADSLTTQLLAIGGVGSMLDIDSGLAWGASAVGVGSFFVFRGPRRAVLISYPDRQQMNRFDKVAND